MVTNYERHEIHLEVNPEMNSYVAFIYRDGVEVDAAAYPRHAFTLTQAVHDIKAIVRSHVHPIQTICQCAYCARKRLAPLSDYDPADYDTEEY